MSSSSTPTRIGLLHEDFRPPYPELMCSNTAPSELQAQEIENLIARAENHLRALPQEDQVPSCWRHHRKGVRDAFGVEIQQIQRLLVEQKRILHPVRRLPVEIIQIILFMAADVDRHYWPYPIPGPWWESGHVCQSWRYAAMTYSRLWTRIHIPLDPRPSALQLEYISEALSRSRDKPLTIFLDFHRIQWPFLQDLSADPALVLLLQQSKRWEAISLSTLHTDLLTPLAGQLEGRLDQLRSVDLFSTSPALRSWTTSSRPPLTLFASAPSLTEVKIDGPRDVTIEFPWAQLTRYAHRYLKEGVLTTAMRAACNSLTRLTFNMDHGMTSWSQERYPSLLFPCLSYLEVVYDGWGHTGVHEVIASITSPTLETLIVDDRMRMSSFRPSIVLEAVEHLILRSPSPPPLRHLAITGWGYHDVISPLLPLLPQIQYLRVPCPSDLARLIVHSGQRDIPLLPFLSHLFIQLNEVEVVDIISEIRRTRDLSTLGVYTLESGTRGLQRRLQGSMKKEPKSRLGPLAESVSQAIVGAPTPVEVPESDLAVVDLDWIRNRQLGYLVDKLSLEDLSQRLLEMENIISSKIEEVTAEDILESQADIVIKNLRLVFWPRIQGQADMTVLNDAIGIIGAGMAGLITAHVLLQDGFTNVTLITRDATIGGTWARRRVYPGLQLNNVHGEYRFSSLDMPPPIEEPDAPTTPDGTAPSLRITGADLRDYFESFAEKFLFGKAQFRFQTEVTRLERVQVGQWRVHTKSVDDKDDGPREVLEFKKIVLATGGCSQAFVPPSLSKDAAEKAGFQGLVVHSSEFGPRLPDILAAVKPTPEKLAEGEELDTVLVIGGHKSAQDIAAHLTNQGRKVVMAFERLIPFAASNDPPPDFIRKSRFVNVIFPHHTLNTRLERFLHQTWFGKFLVQTMFSRLEKMAYDDTAQIPKDSPLRPSRPFFWSIPSGDEGSLKPTSFFTLLKQGAITMMVPARASGYALDGKSVILSNGKYVQPKAVLLATGYQSSWTEIIDASLREELGMNKEPLMKDIPNKWAYKTLEGGPPRKEADEGTLTIHRGIVPVKNLNNRDFAIAGAIATSNLAYTGEVVAHWTATYFRNDPLRLPPTQEDARRLAHELATWTRIRYPDLFDALNESSSTSSLDFWSWPQHSDEMLEDMHLPSMRGMPNSSWKWVFTPVDIKDLATLGDERKAKRGEV